MRIRMPIDIKSLYLNIKNDNKTGHTPTVATPLRQGSSIHTELAQILQIPETIGDQSKEGLSSHLLSKSRAEAKIVKAYIFDKVSVNGIPIECPYSYCIYIREETDPNNVHCGRQKVHYPQILDYEDEEICINNNAVIKAVSATLHDYAFIVQAFEYDTDTGYLNFDALIVGENSVPYSKVFVIKRGVGEKFAGIFNEYADIYDSEIIAMRSNLGYDKVSPDNFMEIMNANKELAISLIEEKFLQGSDKDYFVISRQYPYSMYDIEVRNGVQKSFVVLRFTSTKIKYFNLSSNTIRFINDFPESTQIVLITDINGTPQVNVFSSQEIGQMKKTINSVTYEQRGL